MSNEVIEQQGGAVVPAGNPFAKVLALAGGMNVGSVAIEQDRAVAEIQGKMLLARRFPRDVNVAAQEFREACKLPEFAGVAFYSVPRGNKNVTGESVRFAEEAARCWGNIAYGHRELSRSEGKSEVVVYAWDMQTGTNNERQITVMHVIDTRDGPKKCRDQKEIDDLIANKASKQLRGRILAVLPKWLVELGKQQCRDTLAGNAEKPMSARIRDMTDRFAKFGVTVQHLEGYLEHALDLTTADELANLAGVYNALREGAKPSDYFGVADAKEPDTAGAAITAQAKKGAATTAASQNGSAKKDSAAQKSKPSESESKPAKDAVTDKGNKADASPQPKAESQEPPANQPAQGQQQEDGEVF